VERISVISEITNTVDRPTQPPAGWILYDSRCGLCTWAARRHAAVLEKLGYYLRPLRDSELSNPQEIILLTPDNRILPGVDAYLYVLTGLPHTGALVKLLKHPHINRILRRIYRWIADHRIRISQVCRLKPEDAP
jgi:predicted DCC family thiol-disulfide oxidoreductase YuxK